ncbi:MAG: response regulator [Pyrinomonadaceae bacterium]|nr:response regulator [Pyrinomonadaceae bacterium]
MITSREESHAGKLTVLVVDDDDDLRFLIAEILRKEGYCVTEAASAREAEEAALIQTPDLVLMDIGMPGEDGLSAVWRMREHPELAEVPVVIVSAYDSFDLRAEAAAEGCRAYLTKPLDPVVLKSMLGEILRS